MSIQYIDRNAGLVGTAVEPFNVASTNKNLQITIDGGSQQDIVLTEGAARTAAQVAADINASVVGGTAYAVMNGPQTGHVRIRSTSSNGSSSTILIGAPANNCNTLLGFTATTYSGADRRHTSWSQPTGTKQELIDKIESELLAAGWTTISGSGTTNLLMQSALSPPGEDLQMRLRVKDNGGNCVTLSIENVAGTKASTNSTTAGFMLLPAASKNWLLTLNKYQCFIRTSVSTAAREYAAFGIPALPSHLQGVVTEAIWGHSNSLNDTGSGLMASFRTSLLSFFNNNRSNQAAICNGNLIQSNNVQNASSAGQVCLAQFSHNTNAYSVGPFGYLWHDDSALIYDPLIAWGLTAITDNARHRGLLWDAVLSTDAYTGDLTTSFDSHNWIVLTDNNQGTGDHPRGTLLLALP